MSRFAAIFESAVQRALSGATVVTGNDRAERALRAECERRLPRGEVRATPRTIAYGNWLTNLWDAAVLAGYETRVVLNGMQSEALWQEAVNRGPSLAKLAAEAWRLAQQWKLPLDGPEFTARPESRAFRSWARKYGKSVAEGGFIDEASMEAALAPTVAKLRAALPETIVFYGFDRFTRSQKDLITALEACGVEVEIPEPATADWNSASAVRAADTDTELRMAARWARARVEQHPDCRVAVVVPNLESLRREVEQTFLEVLHPEAMPVNAESRPRAFETSLGSPLPEAPVIATAFALLRLGLGDLSVAEASALLLSPFVAGASEERNRRAAADVKLRRKQRGRVPLDAMQAIAEAARCTALFQALGRMKATAPRIGAALKPSQWRAVSTQMLKAAAWPAVAVTTHEFQACKAWEALLSEYATLDGVTEDALGAEDFLRELERHARERTFRPANLGAPVQVLGHLEAAGSQFDAVWICQLTDSVWPPRGRVNPLLPPALARKFGVPHTDCTDDAGFGELVLERLVASASESILSCPNRDENGEVRATAQLGRVQEAHGLELADEFCWRAAGEYACESLIDEEAPPLADSERIIGTAVLEWQSNCPFRAFAQARLRASSLEDTNEGIDPRVRGGLVDAVMKAIWDRFGNQAALRNADRERRAIVEECVDKVMRDPDVLPPPASDWERRFYALERERMIALAEEWLEIDATRAEHFTVLGHQREVQVELGPVTVAGRMDRLEKLDSGNYVIVDYKSGRRAHTPKAWEGERPLEPQLPIYALSIPAERLDGLAFANITRGKCELKGVWARAEIVGAARSTNVRDMATLSDDWRQNIVALAEEYARGEARVEPQKDAHTCNMTYCDLAPLCRYREHALAMESGDE